MKKYKVELDIVNVIRPQPKPIPEDELQASFDAITAEYMELPYTIKLMPEEDGTYYAYVEELPGCATVGDTEEEAMEKIREAMWGWIESNLERGLEIPLPDDRTKTD